MFPEKYWWSLRSWEGDGWEGGFGGHICLKYSVTVGSSVGHSNVSLIVKGRVTKRCIQNHNFSE